MHRIQNTYWRYYVPDILYTGYITHPETQRVMNTLNMEYSGYSTRRKHRISNTEHTRNSTLRIYTCIRCIFHDLCRITILIFIGYSVGIAMIGRVCYSENLVLILIYFAPKSLVDIYLTHVNIFDLHWTHRF